MGDNMSENKKKIRIVSFSEEAFSDRREAGRLLAEALKKYEPAKVVVLGIPRGGMVVARELAVNLGAELDIVLSRKLGAPGNPELAIGAISEDGYVVLDQQMVLATVASESYIEQEKQRQLAEIHRRIRTYRQAKQKVDLSHKTVIITDDGIATGATMQAGLWITRREKPEKLVVAVPVAPEESLGKLAEIADGVLCLRVPAFFGAVGQFYREFTQVDDSEVIEILRRVESSR